MPVELILIVILVGAGYLFYRDIKKSGKTEAQSKANERALKNVSKSNKAIVRARGDKSITDKLRELYKY